jgi:hypothetical protein
MYLSNFNGTTSSLGNSISSMMSRYSHNEILKCCKTLVKELPEALEKAAPAWVLGLVAYSIAQVVVSFLMITQKLARSVLQS